jgi:uncharacterized protein (TIGR03067 family)
MNATLMIAAALTISAPALKDPPKKANDLTGEWVVESTTSAGRMLAVTGNLVYTFTPDGKWLIHRDGMELPATNRGFANDPKPNPPTIDLMSNGTRPETARLGIYKVEADTLTICVGAAKAGRASDFASTADNRYMIYVLKRKKKD